MSRARSLAGAFSALALFGPPSVIGCRTAGPGAPGGPSGSPALSSDGAAGDDDAGDAAGSPETVPLHIATWNVHRFFDTTCESRKCGGDEYEELPTAAEFAARADTLASAIEALDADVVLLQEVESQSCLDALHERLADRYPTAVLGEIGTAASVDVAVLAEAPLLEVRTHREDPIPLARGGTTTFSRELLEVHLDAGGARVIVLAAHFRSKVDDDPARRLAEATASRKVALETSAEHPDALVVLGGDLNDVPGSPPIAALEKGGDLLRVASDLPAGTDWTYAYWDDHFALDHLFVVVDSGGAYEPGSTKVHRTAGKGYAGSDHAALGAVFHAGSP